MDPAFVLLLFASWAGVAAAAVSRIDRLERLGLALFHVVLACVSVAGALADGIGADGVDDGRALVASAAGPFVALLVGVGSQERRTDRLVSLLSGGLLVGGIAAHALLLWRGEGDGVEASVANGGAAFAALVIIADVLRRRAKSSSALARSRATAEMVAGALLLLAALLALFVPPGVRIDQMATPAPWALALTAAGAWATATRLGRATPDVRDVVAIVVGVAFVALVVPRGALPGAAAALVTAVALGRSVWPPGVTRHRKRSADAVVDFDARALGAMAAIVSNAAERVAGRPRVHVRTPARRILDTALDHALRSRPPGEARSAVEVDVGDVDADVEGDASELAAALSAVVEAGLRQPHARPLAVVVRASPQSVSYEVGVGAEDVLPSVDVVVDSDADFRDTLALRRARLVVERHGGALQTRSGPRGHTLQLTLPRRIAPPTIGRA